MIVDCAVYERGKREGGERPFRDAIAATRDRPDSFVWLGLYEPTMDELNELAREFPLHPLAMEDAVHAHQRPKLEVYGDTVFLVLKTASYVDSNEVVELGEIMLFVGHGFVISVRHGQHGALRQVRSRLEGDPERLRCGTSAVLHAVLDEVVDGYERVLQGVDVDVDEIATQVFSGDASDHAQRIFLLKREVLDFDRAVHPLLEPAERLAHGKVPGVDPALGDWFRDAHDHLLRVADQLDSLDSLLDGALSANLAQISVRQNEDMRKISAWAAIAAVPTAVAGIYGMNFEHMPELDSTLGYPFVLVAITIACVWLYRNFKHRGWL